MNPYEQLINQANKKFSQIIRNQPDSVKRLELMRWCKQYQAILKAVQKDYPNATIQEIKKTLVNRLRHTNENYRFAIQWKLPKSVYTNVFIETMNCLSLDYPWLADEVIRQIQRKMKYHDINQVAQSQIIAFNVKNFMSANVFTQTHINKCLRMVENVK